MLNSYSLIVDAGNSFCKFALYNLKTKKNKWTKVCEYHSIEHLLESELTEYNICLIFICSVKKTSVLGAIKKINEIQWKADIEIFNPIKYKLIPSKYKNFKALGADRWAAILAIFLQQHTNFCIIDCGTAITVDYIINSEHIGGLIGPGLDTLSNSLLHATDKIVMDNSIDLQSDISFTGTNTSDCILNASKIYFNSFLETVLAENKTKYGNQFITYITGGDSKKFVNKKKYNVIYSKNLVIQGLFLLSLDKINSI